MDIVGGPKARGMTDKLTRVEMAARLGWWLAHGDSVTIDQVACALYNLDQGELNCLDCFTRADRRRKAKHLLQQISRVLPIIDDGETWQAIEATPPA